MGKISIVKMRSTLFLLDTEISRAIFLYKKGVFQMKYTDCIAFLLAKANQKSQSFLKKKLQPYGLTAVQHLILEVIMEYEGLTPGEIGKRLISDNATISGVLDRMEDAGWIVKATDSHDRRVSRIYLGEKVKAIKEEIHQEREQANEELLQNYSKEEQELLKDFLKKFIS